MAEPSMRTATWLQRKSTSRDDETLVLLGAHDPMLTPRSATFVPVRQQDSPSPAAAAVVRSRHPSSSPGRSRRDPAHFAAFLIGAVIVSVTLVLIVMSLFRPQPPPFMLMRTRSALNTVQDLGWKAPHWLRDYVQFCREPDTNTTQYLIWSCTDQYCGGVGDRARGMLTAFFLAVGTGRKLRLHASKPVDMRLTLQPSWIDWSSGAKSMLKEVGGRPDHLHGSEDLLQFADRVRHDRVASLFTSAMELYPLYTAPQFAAQFAPSPGDPLEVTADNWDVLASWAWAVLFRETAALSAEVAALRHDAGVDGPFIGVHVRRGGHWGDAPRHTDPGVLDRFTGCAANVSAALGNNPIVYVASDDFEVKRRVEAALPGVAVRYDPRPPQHLEQVADFQSQLRIWAEFMLLQQATCIVASQSGFSLWSVATSRNPQTATRCWARFDRCAIADVQRAIREPVPIYAAVSANDPAFEL